MKGNKFLKIASVAVLASTLAACGKEKVSEKEYKEWAEKNGYVLEEGIDYEGWAEENGYIGGVDHTTSATDQGKGINMGAYEWDDALKQATVLEFLKGDQIKDHEGNAKAYNYRSMFSIATAVPEKVNGKTEIVVSNTNVEFTLNPETFELYGMSEAGTTKVLHYLVNQNVSMTWVRQLNATDTAYPQGYGTEADYYHSYGVQVNGKVHVLNADSTDAEFLRVLGHYCPTLGSQAAVWASFTTDAQRIAYGKQLVAAAAIYYVVPESIVISAAYDSQGASALQKVAATNEAEAQGKSKCYTYSVGYETDFKFISEEFWETKIAAKNAALAADEANGYAKLNAAYGDWETRLLTLKALEIGGQQVAKGAVITAEQAAELDEGVDYYEVKNWARAFALDPNTSCGMMSQQILRNFTPVAE